MMLQTAAERLHSSFVALANGDLGYKPILYLFLIDACIGSRGSKHWLHPRLRDNCRLIYVLENGMLVLSGMSTERRPSRRGKYMCRLVSVDCACVLDDAHASSCRRKLEAVCATEII